MPAPVKPTRASGDDDSHPMGGYEEIPWTDEDELISDEVFAELRRERERHERRVARQNASYPSRKPR